MNRVATTALIVMSILLPACAGNRPRPPTSTLAPKTVGQPAPAIQPGVELHLGVETTVPGTDVRVALLHRRGREQGISRRAGIECALPRPAIAALLLRHDGAEQRVSWSSGTYDLFGFEWTVIVDDEVTLRWNRRARVVPR